MNTKILAMVIITPIILNMGCRQTPHNVGNYKNELRNHVFTMDEREYFMVCWLFFNSSADSYFRPIVVIDHRDFQEKSPSFYPVNKNGLFPIRSGNIKIARPVNSIVFFTTEGDVIDLGTLKPEVLFKDDSVLLDQKLDEISNIIKIRFLEFKIDMLQ